MHFSLESKLFATCLSAQERKEMGNTALVPAQLSHVGLSPPLGYTRWQDGVTLIPAKVESKFGLWLKAIGKTQRNRNLKHQKIITSLQLQADSFPDQLQDLQLLNYQLVPLAAIDCQVWHQITHQVIWLMKPSIPSKLIWIFTANSKHLSHHHPKLPELPSLHPNAVNKLAKVQGNRMKHTPSDALRSTAKEINFPLLHKNLGMCC